MCCFFCHFIFTMKSKSEREQAKIFIYLYQFLYHTASNNNNKKKEIQTQKTITFRSPCVIFSSLFLALLIFFVEFNISQMFRTECGHYFMCMRVCVCVLIWILALQEWNHFFVCLFRRFYFGNLNCCCYLLFYCFELSFSLLARCLSVCAFFHRSFLLMSTEYCATFVSLTVYYIYSPLPFTQSKTYTHIQRHRSI